MAGADGVGGRPLEVLYPAETIAEAVDRVAAAVSADHEDGVVLVAVLRGAVFFLADLCRRLTVHPVVDFLAVSAYSPGSGRVRLLKDLDLDVTGRPVILVEEIVDTGLTASFLRDNLLARGPSSVQIATLLDRTERRIVPVGPDYVGLEAPDRFLVGYGLDLEGRYRNLPYVAVGPEPEPAPARNRGRATPPVGRG